MSEVEQNALRKVDHYRTRHKKCVFCRFAEFGPDVPGAGSGCWCKAKKKSVRPYIRRLCSVFLLKSLERV